MTGPRVALLTREFPPEVYGGAGVHVEYLARHLAERIDVEVHAFGADRDDPLVAASYRPWEELAGEAAYLAALRTVSVDLAMARGVEGRDLVHSHTWYANLAGHLAKLVHDVPHVVTTHSLEPLRPWKAEQLGGGYAVSSFCERTAIEDADAVIAVSEGMREDILACYPATDPARVVVVHNGIDPAEYRPTPDRGVLTAHGIDASRPYAVFVGRITRQKGVVHLLDAARSMPAWAQLVLCAGAPDTPEIAAEFRAKVEELQAATEAPDVVWIESMLPRRDVVAILSQARVFVCPSIYEPFGIVNLEAMACELPVVASAVGGIPEVVADGETGYLVELEASGDDSGSPRDPAAFAAALGDTTNRLLDDVELARRMGIAGRDRVVERFSWTAIAERTVEVYRSVMG